MAFDPAKSRWNKEIFHYGDRPIQEGRRILICGPYGSGKTTLADTAPNVLFFDADYGENKRLREHHNPGIYIPYGLTPTRESGTYARISGLLDDWIAGRDVFDPDGGPYADRRSLVLDTWSKVNEQILFELCEQSGLDITKDKPGYNEFGRLKQMQQVLMRKMKTLAIRRGVNIIGTALAMFEGDEVEKLKRDEKNANAKSGFSNVMGRPDLVGAFRRSIGAEFEEVYFLEVVQGAVPIYRLHTQPKASFQTKSRFELPKVIDDPTWDKIIKLIGETAK